jgi:hypothetical protein
MSKLFCFAWIASEPAHPEQNTIDVKLFLSQKL